MLVHNSKIPELLQLVVNVLEEPLQKQGIIRDWSPSETNFIGKGNNNTVLQLVSCDRPLSKSTFLEVLESFRYDSIFKNSSIKMKKGNPLTSISGMNVYNIDSPTRASKMQTTKIRHSCSKFLYMMRALKTTLEKHIKDQSNASNSFKNFFYSEKLNKMHKLKVRTGIIASKLEMFYLNYEMALDILFECKFHSRKTKDWKMLKTVYFLIARTMFSAQKFKTSVLFCQRALELSWEQNDFRTEMESLDLMGQCYFNLEEYGQAHYLHCRVGLHFATLDCPYRYFLILRPQGDIANRKTAILREQLQRI